MATKLKIAIVLTGLGGAIAVFAFIFIRARSTTAREAAIQNMREIEAAKERWAIEDSNAAHRVSAATNSLRTP